MRARRRLSWRLAETLFAHLGHIVLGSPKSASDMSSVGVYEVSAEQHIRFELLVEDVLRVCCLEASESRGTKRLATHVRNCFCSQRLHSLSTNASIYQLVSKSAKPVDPMRANTPVTSASIKPGDVLKGNMRNTFCNQQSLAFDSEPPGCPRRCHMISTANEVVRFERSSFTQLFS